MTTAVGGSTRVVPRGANEDIDAAPPPEPVEAPEVAEAEAARLRSTLLASRFEAGERAPVSLTADEAASATAPVDAPTFRVNPATGQLMETTPAVTGRARALSATSSIDGEDGEVAPAGPYPGVDVTLNGQVVSLNAVIEQGAALSTRDRMSLVMQLVDQNIPITPPGTTPMTVNGIDLATTTHHELDVQGALQRFAERGSANSEDRAIIQAELLAQMGVPKDRMQVCYGNRCDASGAKLNSEAQLMVLAPADDGKPYANSTRSQWVAMQPNASGQPQTANDFADRVWCYADGKVSYLPRTGGLNDVPSVDNSRGFFVPVFGVQADPGFLRGNNVVDYSKLEAIKRSMTGGAAYVSIEGAYQLMKVAPGFIENKSPTQVLFDRYQSETLNRASAQAPAGKDVLSYLNGIRDWTPFSMATLEHLGLPPSAHEPFVARLKADLRHATLEQASLDLRDMGSSDWLRGMGTLLADGTHLERPTVDDDGYLVGISTSFDDTEVTEDPGSRTVLAGLDAEFEGLGPAFEPGEADLESPPAEAGVRPVVTKALPEKMAAVKSFADGLARQTDITARYTENGPNQVLRVWSADGRQVTYRFNNGEPVGRDENFDNRDSGAAAAMAKVAQRADELRKDPANARVVLLNDYADGWQGIVVFRKDQSAPTITSYRDGELVSSEQTGPRSNATTDAVDDAVNRFKVPRYLAEQWATNVELGRPLMPSEMPAAVARAGALSTTGIFTASGQGEFSPNASGGMARVMINGEWRVVVTSNNHVVEQGETTRIGLMASNGNVVEIPLAGQSIVSNGVVTNGRLVSGGTPTAGSPGTDGWLMTIPTASFAQLRPGASISDLPLLDTRAPAAGTKFFGFGFAGIANSSGAQYRPDNLIGNVGTLAGTTAGVATGNMPLDSTHPPLTGGTSGGPLMYYNAQGQLVLGGSLAGSITVGSGQSGYSYLVQYSTFEALLPSGSGS